jgi:hypothetical protein
MSSSEPRLPEQFRSGELQVGDFHVNELAADRAGAMSPFGPDIEFPLPLDQIDYTHPSREHRPNLAGGLQ